MRKDIKVMFVLAVLTFVANSAHAGISFSCYLQALTYNNAGPVSNGSNSPQNATVGWLPAGDCAANETSQSMGLGVAGATSNATSTVNAASSWKIHDGSFVLYGHVSVANLASALGYVLDVGPPPQYDAASAYGSVTGDLQWQISYDATDSFSWTYVCAGENNKAGHCYDSQTLILAYPILIESGVVTNGVVTSGAVPLGGVGIFDQDYVSASAGGNDPGRSQTYDDSTTYTLVITPLGKKGVALASANPTTLSFSGTANSVQTITVTNAGTALLTIDSATVTGNNVDAFSTTDGCSAAVDVGANCTISVTFTPTTAGPNSATLTIASNGARSPATVAMTGTASAPTVAPHVVGTQSSNGSGWYISRPTKLSWKLTGDPAPTNSGCGAVTVPDTTGTTYTCTATNTVVTASQSVIIKKDTVAPTVVIKKPANGATYTAGQTVLASYTCTDATSGVASCLGTVPVGTPIDTSVSNTFTVTATDNAGNITTKSVSYTVN